jgi:hypothetical protein
MWTPSRRPPLWASKTRKSQDCSVAQLSAFLGTTEVSLQSALAYHRRPHHSRVVRRLPQVLEDSPPAVAVPEPTVAEDWAVAVIKSRYLNWTAEQNRYRHCPRAAPAATGLSRPTNSEVQMLAPQRLHLSLAASKDCEMQV